MRMPGRLEGPTKKRAMSPGASNVVAIDWKPKTRFFVDRFTYDPEAIRDPDPDPDPGPIRPLPGSGLNPPSDPPVLGAELPDPDDGDDEDDGNLIEWADIEAQKRLMIRTLIPLLQLRSHDTDPSGRVQLAFDLMSIAVCERLCRIARSDLGKDQG